MGWGKEGRCILLGVILCQRNECRGCVCVCPVLGVAGEGGRVRLFHNPPLSWDEGMGGVCCCSCNIPKESVGWEKDVAAWRG